jgi:C-methyltransferase-like protein/putative zinc binding protein
VQNLTDPAPAATTTAAITCRFCGSPDGRIVLDLGHQPSSELFPRAEDLGTDPVYPLRMWLCAGCGLAQLADDTIVPEEVLGREPAALTEQRRAAVAAVASAGVLPEGGTAMEFPSPHGGTWLDGLAAHGFTPVPLGGRADVVVDGCFGLMHEADQRAALRTRVDAVAPGGALVLLFHSLAAIMEGDQWNALRLGHFAYYSTPGMVGMLAELGMTVTSAHRFALYGGTVVLTASRDAAPDTRTLPDLLAAERETGVLDAAAVGALGAAVGRTVTTLRTQLEEHRAAGRRVYGYAAASRAVSLLCMVGADRTLLAGVADASPAKLGRRMPGTDVPVISPEQLVAADPDVVLVFVSDVLDEVRRALPQITADRWVDPVS